MMNSRLLIILFLGLFCSGIVRAQEKPKVFFNNGKVYNKITNQPMGGVTIEVRKNGTLVETKTSASNGKFKLAPLDIENNYTITFIYSGYLTRTVEVNLNGIPPEHWYEEGWEFPMDMTMVEKVPDVNFSPVEGKPTAVFKYNKADETIVYDDKVTAAYNKELDKIMQQIIDKQKGEKDKEAKFAALVAAGDAAVKVPDYVTAIAKYTEALTVKDDPGVKTKLEDAKTKQTALENAKGTEKKYQEFLATADNAYKAKDYATAKENYKKALEVKPGEKIPTDKIIEIDKIINDAIKKDQDYSKAIDDGNKLLQDKKYDEAIAKYTEAGKIKPTEQEPKDLIKKATDEKNGAASKEKDFANYVKKGDDAVKVPKYDDAISAYEAALAIKTDAGVQAKLDKAKTDRDNADKLAKTKRDYDEKMAEADAFFASSEWDKAITAYTAASVIIPTEQKPKDQIAAAKAKKALAEQNAANEKKYNDLITQADKEFTASEWDKAIATYTLAQPLKPTEKYPAEQIAKAKENKLNADKLEAQNKAYSDLMAKAETEMTAKTWDKAIATYEAALKIKPDEQKPKDQIEIAKTNKQNELDAAAKLAQAKLLVAKGDAAMPLKKYDEAIEAYQQALDLVNDPATKTKLDAAKKAKDDAELANKEKEALEKKYNDLIAEADSEFGNSNWQKSIDKYDAALKIKAGEKYPTDQIVKAKAEIAKIEKNAAQDKQFNDLMAQGDKELEAKTWDKAIATYEAAKKLKPTESRPQEQIEIARQKKQEELDLLAKQKKAKEFETKGDAAMALPVKKFDDAINYYQQSVDLIEDPAVKKKLDDAKAAKEAAELALKSQAEKDQQYKDLIAQADGEFAGAEWDKAIATYQSALSIKDKEKYPADQIAKAKAKKLELEKAAELEKQYSELMAKADSDFGGSKWDDAIAKYEAALKLKPLEKLPKDQIAEAKRKKAEEELAKTNETQRLASYKAAYEAGIGHYSAGEWDLAIAKFESALTFKPNDQPATDYIEKAKKEKEETAARLRKMYDDIIRQADKDFDANNYGEAQGYYSRAAKMFPNEQHPKDRLKEIEQKLGDQKALAAKKTQYDAAIVLADAQFNAGKFQASIPLYENAIKILDEKYPHDQIDKANAELEKIKNLAEEKARIDAEYKELIAKADAEFTGKNYDAAVDFYTQAKGKKPAEKYPNDQLAKIALLKGDLSKQQELLRRYKEKIDAADALFNSEKYEESKLVYTEAAKIKSDEKYPQEQIDKANARLKEITDAELQKQYELLIAQADKDFNAEKWEDARGYYSRAANFRPNDPYPKTKIGEIDAKLALLKGAEAKRKQFDLIVKRADGELKGEQFDKSIASYNEALKILDEQYPKDQIAEANRLKAEFMAKQGARQRYKIAMDAGMNNYNAGTFDKAIGNFEEALVIIPNDAEAEKMLKKAKAEFENKRAFFEQQYAAIIKSADENFNDKKLPEAKELYQRALRLKNGEPYPQEQLRKIAELELQTAGANNYNKIIAEANKLFGEKKYGKARDLYVQASDMQPAIEYPKVKIKEIDDLLNPKNNTTNNTNFANNNQNVPVVNEAVLKETYYGTPVNVSISEAQAMMVKSRMDDDAYRYDDIDKEKMDQEQLLKTSSIAQDERRIEQDQLFTKMEAEVDAMNDRGEEKRQENVAAYANEKERIENDNGQMSHARNDFLQSEYQRYEQIKTDFIYNAVGTDEIRKANVINLADFKEDRYNAESALEGTTNDKREDKNEQLIKDQFALTDQLATADTARENNARNMAIYKENRYNAESALEGNTDEKRMAKNDQLRNDQFALTDQLATADTARENNARNMAIYKENRYNAESALEGSTDEKRMAKNDQLKNDQFALTDQLATADTIRFNNALALADYKERRYDAESELEGTTNDKRQDKNEQLIKDQFALTDQLATADTARENNARNMARYKENRYNAESALEGNTDEKRMAKNDKLKNDQFALVDQLATIDTIRVNNTIELANYKENRYNKESDLSTGYEAKIMTKNDSLVAQQIRREEKAGEMSKMPDANVKKLKEEEDIRNAKTAEISANGDVNRTKNQNQLESQKYQVNDPRAGDKGVLVSEKSFQRNDAEGKPAEITIQRMIKKGNTVFEYLMVINKQGNTYFKNGSPISENQWSVETAVPKE